MKRVNVSIFLVMSCVLIMQVLGMIPSHAEEMQDSPDLTILLNDESRDSIQPVQIAAEYSTRELMKHFLAEKDFTFIDPEKGVIIDHVLGVYLEDLLLEAKIDLDSVETLVFQSGESKVAFSASDLLSRDQYCFFSLPDHYEDGSYLTDQTVPLFCEKTKTILALQDHWMPVSEGGMFWSNPAEMSDENAIRLVFGQADIAEQKADLSLSHIHTVEVVLKEQLPIIPEILPAEEIKNPVTVDSDGWNNKEIAEQTVTEPVYSPDETVHMAEGMDSLFPHEVQHQGKRQTISDGQTGGETSAFDAGRAVPGPTGEIRMPEGHDSGTEEKFFSSENGMFQPADAGTSSEEMNSGTDSKDVVTKYRIRNFTPDKAREPGLFAENNLIYGQVFLSSIPYRLIVLTLLFGAGFLYYRRENWNRL